MLQTTFLTPISSFRGGFLKSANVSIVLVPLRICISVPIYEAYVVTSL